MRIFVIASDVPAPRHERVEVTAVNVVIFELLNELRRLGYDISLQVIFNAHREGRPLDTHEQVHLKELREQGMDVLDPVLPPDPIARRRPGLRLRRLVRPAVEDFYPTVRLRPLVRARIQASRTDAILSIWSPEGVAAAVGSGLPIFSYHGDVDFAPALARHHDSVLFGLPSHPLSRWRRVRWLSAFRNIHVKLMRDIDIVACVTAANAEFYRAQGHSRPIYLQNTWTDLGGKALPLAESRYAGSRTEPIRIVGHVGGLGRTGNTYGLRFLLGELIPALEGVMAGVDYRIHIIGAGEPVPALRPLLRHPRVIVRGFLPDLDAELMVSDLFLLLNNAGSYYAAYTRHIIAWSMGLCLVTHANSIPAIPELVPGENVLAASAAADLAVLIARAATDPTFNLGIRRGGRNTYTRFFTPARVAERIGEELDTLTSSRQSARRLPIGVYR